MLLTILSESNTKLIENELLESFLDFGNYLLKNGNNQV